MPAQSEIAYYQQEGLYRIQKLIAALYAAAPASLDDRETVPRIGRRGFKP